MCEIAGKIAILFILQFTKADQPCSAMYGATPCNFLPTTLGKTPPCAHPGQTYCENVEKYPGELIHFLIKNWRFDYSTFLTDETKDDFSSYSYPPRNDHNFLDHNTYFPEPIYIPKPHISFEPEKNYIPPKINFTGYPNRRPPTFDFGNFQFPMSNLFKSQNLPQFNAYGHFHKREGKEFFLRLKRSINATKASLKRDKRQSSLSGEPLCATRSQYIMPKVALNNRGNWMYVVNMPEFDPNFTQLVKSETCASQTCNGACTLPLGYTSRCEQKYVQKRLVALEAGGNQLYNDMFWFPSCCICTLSTS